MNSTEFFPGLTSVAIDVSFVETFIAIVFCSSVSVSFSLYLLRSFQHRVNNTLADSAHANAVARIPRCDFLYKIGKNIFLRKKIMPPV